jgi:class 3 adenylate cyclase
MLEWFGLDTIDEVTSKYIFFEDRSDDENRRFQTYIHGLMSRLSKPLLLAIFFLILLTWPGDYYLFKDESIRRAYFWWRLTGLSGIALILLAGYLSDRVEENFMFLICLGAVGFNFMSGYFFSLATGFGDPWFSVIYTLPAMTILIPVKLVSRIVLTFSFPLLCFLGYLVNQPIAELSYPTMQVLLMSGNCISIIMLGHGIYVIIRQNYFQSIELEEERKKSDKLLKNTLPEPVVERLKRGDEISDRFDEVTVLFADIVDFTPLADELEAREVVHLLDDIFSAFDGLVRDRNVEKIKTIGDEYFVASGVPEPVDDHAIECAELALGMQDALTEFAHHDRSSFSLRIGINTGSLVGGIIGENRFAYDVWGDIVNVASRMESQGKPDRIQVTPTTKDTISKQDSKGKFTFTERDPLEIKGKGNMTTYFLEPC